MIGIYKITFIPKNIVYIGQSLDISTRLSQHRNKLSLNKHENSKLQNYYNKYWLDSFKFEIIEQCKENELTDREQYWIDYYGGIESKNTFNSRTAELKGHLSEHTKTLLSISHKGLLTGDKNPSKRLDVRKKISNKLRGRKNPMKTYELRLKMSKTRKEKGIAKGKNNPKAFSVLQYDLNMNFIAEYETCKEASVKTHTHFTSISAVVNGKRKKANNFIWIKKE